MEKIEYIIVFHFKQNPGLPPPPTPLDVSLVEDVEFPALPDEVMTLMRSHLTVNDESEDKLQDVEVPPVPEEKLGAAGRSDGSYEGPINS